MTGDRHSEIEELFESLTVATPQESASTPTSESTTVPITSAESAPEAASRPPADLDPFAAVDSALSDIEARVAEVRRLLREARLQGRGQEA